MRPASYSMLRGATWLYVGSLAAIGSLALFSLCFNLLTMAVQLVATLMQQIGPEL